MTEGYVELHAASAFSFLEGASQPESLIERAVALEMPAMALLDRNGVYGSARFHTSAKRNKIPREETLFAIFAAFCLILLFAVLFFAFLR